MTSAAAGLLLEQGHHLEQLGAVLRAGARDRLARALGLPATRARELALDALLASKDAAACPSA